MPRVSMSSRDAVEVSLGIQEGVIEIVKAVTVIHQFPPNKVTGEQGEPFPCVQFTVVRCDDAGQRVSDDEITEQFGIGKIDKFHPGLATSVDDENPEDLGTEVGVEGNCLFVVSESSKLNKNCKWIKFASSLEEKGFKPEVLGHGYMPELVGTILKVKTITLPRNPGYTGKKDPSALVADRILTFPYDKKKAPAKSAPAAKAVAAPAAAESDADGLALEYLGIIAAEFAGKDAIERKKLQTAVQAKLMRNGIPAKQHAGILKFIKDDEWLSRVTTDADSAVYGLLMVDLEAGTVQFA